MKNVLEILKQTDQSVIHWIEISVTGRFALGFWNIFTYIGYFAAGWIVFFILFSLKKKKPYVWRLWIVTFVCAFLISEGILKNIFQRPRPFMEMEAITVQTIRSSTFSFPSSHALFSGASVYILLALETNWNVRIIVVLVSILVSLSRVFLKVHYPSDVLAGYFLGILIGLSCSRILKGVSRASSAPGTK